MAYFKNKGYNFTKNGDSFIVKISDLDTKTTTKIKLKCDSPNCEEVFEMEYRFYLDRKSNNAKDFCPMCKRRSNENGKNFYSTVIVKGFAEKGLSLLPNQEYKNNNTKLKFLCNEHIDIGVQSISWRLFGQVKQPCKSCRDKLKLSNFEELEKYLLEEKGLLLSPNQEVYSNSQNIYYTCLKHEKFGEESSRLGRVLERDGCRRCVSERIGKKNSGSNSPFWKGGKNKLSEFLRESDIVKSWKMDILKHYNYKCGIYGENGNLEVHHKYSFNKIIDDMLNDLDLPLKENIGLYNDEEIFRMKQYIKEIHTMELGVPLLPKVHKQYHKIYKYNNTYKQFEEFKKRCMNGEFETLLCFEKE